MEFVILTQQAVIAVAVIMVIAYVSSYSYNKLKKAWSNGEVDDEYKDLSPLYSDETTKRTPEVAPKGYSGETNAYFNEAGVMIAKRPPKVITEEILEESTAPVQQAAFDRMVVLNEEDFKKDLAHMNVAGSVVERVTESSPFYYPNQH